MPGPAERLSDSDTEAPNQWPSDAERQAQMARLHYPFIWRSLRRLGVDGGGGIGTFPAFAMNPRKMRLNNNGVYVADYVFAACP